jgi:hypothetical protein
MSALTSRPRARGVADLSDREIAAATGAKPSTVHDWLKARSSPSGERAARLIELAEMADRLTQVVDPEYIPIWLNRPIGALDNDKPARARRPPLLGARHARRSTGEEAMTSSRRAQWTAHPHGQV